MMSGIREDSRYSTIDNSGIEKWRFDTEDEVTSCPVIDAQGVKLYRSRLLFCSISKWNYEMEIRFSYLDFNGSRNR